LQNLPGGGPGVGTDPGSNPGCPSSWDPGGTGGGEDGGGGGREDRTTAGTGSGPVPLPSHSEQWAFNDFVTRLSRLVFPTTLRSQCP
jgi:hypothetical protein